MNELNELNLYNLNPFLVTGPSLASKLINYHKLQLTLSPYYKLQLMLSPYYILQLPLSHYYITLRAETGTLALLWCTSTYIFWVRN